MRSGVSDGGECLEVRNWGSATEDTVDTEKVMRGERRASRHVIRGWAGFVLGSERLVGAGVTYVRRSIV